MTSAHETIIMIWYIRKLNIICDRFPLPILNNYILLIVILFIRGIVVVWLKIIVLLINILSIITATSILTLVFFTQIYYCSSGRSMYTQKERHTRNFLLLVLAILCPSPARSRTWRWRFLWEKCISHNNCLIDSCL